MSRKRRNSEPHYRCIECYAADHTSEECTSKRLTSCYNCFRINVFTTTCNCIDRPTSPPTQVLRLVGKSQAPRWFVDITIHGRLFAALINPSLERGCVSRRVADWLNETAEKGTKVTKDKVTFRFKRNTLKLQITCDISKQLADDLHIGADLMKFLGYTFSMENVTIDSNETYVASSPFETDYVYNLPEKGQHLRNHLQEQAFFLKMKRSMKEHYGIPINSQSFQNRRVIRIFRTLSIDSDATTEPNTDSDNEQAPQQHCSSTS